MGSSHPNLLYTASPSHFFYTVPAFFLYFLLLLLFILLFTLSILFTVGKTSRQKDSTLQNTQVPTQQKDNENATYSTPPNSLVLSCLTHTHTERTYDKISHAKKKNKKGPHTHTNTHTTKTPQQKCLPHTQCPHICAANSTHHGTSPVAKPPRQKQSSQPLLPRLLHHPSCCRLTLPRMKRSFPNGEEARLQTRQVHRHSRLRLLGIDRY